jgi:CheY-specific phosphatase CheX
VESRDWEHINEIVVGCAEALFSAVGLPIRRASHTEEVVGASPQMLSLIGFGGSQLRGAVLLSASRPVLERSYPIRHADAVSDDDLRDWSAELVNQLLGRIKNQLLSRGVTIQLSTPTAISGVQIVVGAAWTNAACVPHRFDVGAERLSMRFEAVASDNVVLADGGMDEPALGETDILLF